MSNKDEQEFVDLSWKLIEYKIFYYQPGMVHESWFDILTIPDEQYDTLERRYLTLCVKLKHRNTVVHKKYSDITGYEGNGMMEIDINRPSVQLVTNKLGNKRLDKPAP